MNWVSYDTNGGVKHIYIIMYRNLPFFRSVIFHVQIFHVKLFSYNPIKRKLFYTYKLVAEGMFADSGPLVYTLVGGMMK